MIDQADWLAGIAALAARDELKRLASDRNLLMRAMIREVENVNAGAGQQLIELREAA